VLLVAVVALAGALDLAITNPSASSHTVTTTTTATSTFQVTTTSTVTATSTTTTTTTVTAGLNLSAVCSTASSLPILPIPNMPWFTAGVTYPGSWEAFAVVSDNGSIVFSGCYAGTGQGYFIYQNATLSSKATIQITAYKLDGSTNALQLGVNNRTSSTSAPYGSATVAAPVAGLAI